MMSRFQRRMEQGDRQQAAYERQMAMDAVYSANRENAGAVVTCGAIQSADLSGEPGHVQSVRVDSGVRGGRPYRRVRVSYVLYGLAANVSRLPEVGGEPVAAGDLTPEDVEHARGTHVEFVRMARRRRGEDGPHTPSELTTAVDRYITERWDPDWTDRERVAARMGDGDGDE